MSQIKIDSIVPAKADMWDWIWWNCPYSTYFHSREWAEIWSRYNKETMSPQPILIKFNDGTKALLPISLSNKRYVSSPAGTYGGWLSIDPLTRKHSALLIEYILSLGKLRWRINPYDELAVHKNMPVSRYDETHTLHLSNGFDDIFSHWAPEHRRKARKALREGISVRSANNQKDWRAYFGTYEDTLRRWGKKAKYSYSWELFEDMYRRKSSHIKLWVAEYQDTIVGGALNLHSKHHVAGWHAAVLEQYLPLSPAVLIQYTAIAHACEREYRWYDFNPSGGHSGVVLFKKGFGAITLPSPVIKL